MPCRLATAATGSRSASRMIATICSSENRPFRIAPSESGASLSTYRWSENPGAGHPHHEGFQQKNVEVCRLGATMARLTACFQSGLLALQRVRAGGRQVVTVQHVHVAEGGQAGFAANVNGKRRGGTPAERRRGGSRNGE